MLAADLLDLAHGVQLHSLRMSETDRSNGIRSELSVFVGDILHLNDHLERNGLLHHRQNLDGFHTAAHNALHLRLSQDVENGVGAERLISRHNSQTVGIASLLENIPLQTIPREDTDAAQLYLRRRKRQYIILLWNEIQVKKTTAEVLDALPNFTVSQPHIVPGVTVFVLEGYIQEEKPTIGRIP